MMKSSTCWMVIALLPMLLPLVGAQQSPRVALHQEVSSSIQAASCTVVVHIPQRPPEYFLQAITSAMLQALSTNCRLQLSPLTRGQEWWDAGAACTVSNDCILESFLPINGSDSAMAVRHQNWDDLAMSEYFLNGAGLLWQWSHTPSLARGSGCWTSAAVLSYLMRPTGATQAVIDSAAAAMPDKFTCCYYGNRACQMVADRHSDLLTGVKLVQVGHSHTHTACVSGDAWCSSNWSNLGAMAQRVVLHHICARSTTLIGPINGINVKVATLLHFASTSKLPELLSFEGHNIWNDAWGFASCTSEELFKEQQHQAAHAGARYESDPPVIHGRPYNDVPAPSPACGGCNDQLQCTPTAQLSAMTAPNKWPLLNFMGTAAHTGERRFNHNCSVDTVMNQSTRSYTGAVCCGHGSSTGLVHIQRHPQLQHCSVVVLTYIGDGKDLLKQPATLQDIPDSPSSQVCYVAVFDPVTARFHNLAPKGSGGLMQLGMWTVVTLVNSPYYQRDLPHWSPRRNLHIFKMIGFRLFPNADYVVWVDGKLKLMQDPRLTVRATFPNGGSENFAIVRHPDRTSTWQEMAIEKQLAGANARSKDHLENLAKVEELYKQYGMPQNATSGLLDSALMVLANTPATHKYFCMLWSLSHELTARDQVLFHFMMHHMDYARGRDYIEVGPASCLFNGITKHIPHLW
ncbi:hypothetical protein COO60DRAFT_504844 [Scenedesmus sp. NREL 46B-D3]|nr:hypothetical protein COO60DRAFT_504844 [Scenedesmus sp. NREL 46B-D3]